MTPVLRFAGLALVLALAALRPARADVSRVENLKRSDVRGGRSFGAAGPYEQIVGKLVVAVDPGNKWNQVITDLDKAPKNGAGKVEFSTDLVILRPRDASRGNGIALFDIVNRGRTTLLGRFDAPVEGGAGAEDELGDAFLLSRGYTIVQVGWEFDVMRGIRMETPRAVGVTGFAGVRFIPTSKDADFTVADLAGYSSSDPASPENTLTVRDTPQGPATTIPRARWRLTTKNVVTLDGGFEPGRIYDIAYKAENPPVAALGFAAVRDAAAWVKFSSDATVKTKYAIAYGSSQTGRFLREFLYDGFNTDEHDRQVFDGVFAHTAGTGDVKLNRRWSTPVSLSTDIAMFFPFSDVKQRDPVTGVEEGVLDNARSAGHQPKVFWTNTGTEYWQKQVSLSATTPDGLKDVALPANSRLYFLAGTHHGGGQKLPPAITNGQQLDNPNEYIWAMRALMVSMEKWVLQGTAPLPSRYPRWQDKTLVRASEVAFPDLPGVTSPRKILAASRGANHLLPKNGGEGTPLPFFVPQVDRDGNEISGIRLPELVVPLATTTGWNYRNEKIGGTHLMFPLLGSYIAFASTRAQREQARDPRPSIEERYQSRDQYLQKIRDAAAPLVKDGYLLADDVPMIVAHASKHWDTLAARRATN